MRPKTALIRFSINHYKLVALVIALFILATGAFMPLVTIDADPENMLEKDEPVRAFHNESKRWFNLSDTIVLGIINERDPDDLSGVIEVDMVAQSLADHMSRQGPGSIKFEWLMSHPPETRDEARLIRDKALSNPLLKGQVISEDGKALCIHLPLTDKLLSYRVYEELNKKIKEINGDEEYHIAGLPVAESAIGVEMFNQMTFAEPLAMPVIFGLLFLFFRKLVPVILPMIVATVSVVSHWDL